MKLNKKIFSFLLAFAMIFSCFADIIPVAAESLPKEKIGELKGVKNGNKLEFAFEIPQNESAKGSAYTTDDGLGVSGYDFEAQGAGQNDTTIELITKGLNGGKFDWTALPNSEFKLIAKWDTTDGQSHEKTIGPITKDGVRQFNVDWPVDGTLKGKAVLQAQYDRDINIRVQFIPATGKGYSGGFTFKVTLEELAESRADVKYVDPYGTELKEAADFPTGTMPKVTAEQLSDASIELPKTSGQINMREDKDNIDLDELHTAASGLTYKVDGKANGETVKIDGKDYKLDISAPNAKQIGTIKMVYQKDVVIPPTKDDGSGKPVDVADGYVRLTFDANENKQDGIKGTHQAGAYTGQQKSYIDVKKGVKYDNENLKAAIKLLSTKGTKEVNGKKKEYLQDTKTPWSPAVPDDATSVETKEPKTYNAQYTKDIAEQIKEAGGIDPQDIVVWKDTPVKDITWKDGTKLAAGVTEQALKDAYANATFTEATVPARQTNEVKTLPGKIKVEFADGSSIIVGKEANKPQNLIVVEHKNEVTDPQNPPVVPKDAIEVEFKLGKGTKLDQTTGNETTPVLVKTMLVKPDTTLVDGDFPAAEKTNTNAKDVVWTPAKNTKIAKPAETKPYYVEKTGNEKYDKFIFTATSSENVPTTKNSEDYDPHYVNKSGKAGETVQIDKPTFTKKGEQGTVPAPTDGTKKTTFTKNDTTQTNVTVDPNTGAISVVIPTTAKVGDKIKVPVDVTYPDGSNETVEVIITVIDQENPTINQPYEGDKTIKGKGEPESDIVVELPDGTKVPGKVDKDGNWEVKVPEDKPLKPGDEIVAKQTKNGKEKEATATVMFRQYYLTLTLDENYRGGRVSDYDAYQGDLIEGYLYRPHRRGYVFEGWSYNSRRLDEVRPGDRIEYSTILYAIWSKQKPKDDEEVEPIDTREVGEHKAYMFGYTDGTVRPNGYITRAEAAALVTRLLGLDTFASAAEPAFTDTPSSWYNKAINAAVQRGIMKGYPDKSFRPNAPITRAEFTQMISTIDNKPYGVAPFADVVGHWAERPIGSEYQAGRIMGYPDGTFRPNAFITRAEAVVILNKIFERNYDAMSAMNAKNKEYIKRFIDLAPSFWGFNDMVEATNTHLFKRRVKGSVQEDWVEVK